MALPTELWLETLAYWCNDLIGCMYIDVMIYAIISMLLYIYIYCSCMMMITWYFWLSNWYELFIHFWSNIRNIRNINPQWTRIFDSFLLVFPSQLTKASQKIQAGSTKQCVLVFIEDNYLFFPLEEWIMVLVTIWVHVRFLSDLFLAKSNGKK